MLPSIKVKSSLNSDGLGDNFERNTIAATMETAVQRHYKELKKLED